MSAPDHFARDEEGREFAGRHLLIDLWGCDPSMLRDGAQVCRGIRAAVEAIGARMMGESHATQFPGEEGGATAFAVLAESHIAVHTWPERRYVAADVFTCGDTLPDAAIDALAAVYGATATGCMRIDRGFQPPPHEEHDP